jgi:hypothetical protein
MRSILYSGVSWGRRYHFRREGGNMVKPKIYNPEYKYVGEYKYNTVALIDVLFP